MCDFAERSLSKNLLKSLEKIPDFLTVQPLCNIPGIAIANDSVVVLWDLQIPGCC